MLTKAMARTCHDDQDSSGALETRILPAMHVKAKATVNNAASMMKTTFDQHMRLDLTQNILSSANIRRTYLARANMRKATVNTTRTMNTAHDILTLFTLEDRSKTSN